MTGRPRWRDPLHRQAFFALISMAACVSVVLRLTHLWWLILVAIVVQGCAGWGLVAFGVQLADAHPRKDGPHGDD